MPEIQDFNSRIIDEFRANQGKVGGTFQGAPMVLIHHRGAKTGTQRINPLVYQPVGESYAIFASKGGAPDHPQWYRNLIAHPETEAEIGEETIPVRVREVSGDERLEIWERQKKLMPGFAQYEDKAGGRQIPVLLLERRDLT